MQRYLSWESKILKKFKAKPLAFSLVFIGILLLTFGGVNYFRVRRLSFNKVPPTASAAVTDIDVPIEVIIPSLNLDLPVDPGNIMDGVWQISANNATYSTSSSPPGSGGNTVIYGHNLKRVFGNLPYLSEGQKVSVKTKSGKLYHYTVTEKHFVGPDRVDLVSPTEEPTLTIYTCWGAFDRQRVVVVAKPIN